MKYIYLLLLIGTLAACAQQSPDHFVLRGHVPGAIDSTEVTLKVRTGQEQQLASGYIINERFELHGKLDFPMPCKLSLDDYNYLARSKGDLNRVRYCEIDFFVENGKLSFVTPHRDSLPQAFWQHDIRQEKNYKVKGSAAQDVYYRYQQQTIPLRYEIQLKKREYMAQGIETLQEQLDNQCREFIQNNSHLAVNLYIAGFLKKSVFTYDQAYLNELEQLFASCRDTCAELKNFRQYLYDAARFVQGTPLQECDIIDTKGETVSLLSQLNTEGYTFIDFWASWCIPCRVSFIHLREVYKHYGEKVHFLSISLDQKQEEWIRAMNEDQLPWPQFLGKSSFAQEISELYGIYGIPTFLLIDPAGKIVFSGFDSSNLEKELKKIQ